LERRDKIVAKIKVGVIGCGRIVTNHCEKALSRITFTIIAKNLQVETTPEGYLITRRKDGSVER